MCDAGCFPFEKSSFCDQNSDKNCGKPGSPQSTTEYKPYMQPLSPSLFTSFPDIYTHKSLHKQACVMHRCLFSVSWNYTCCFCCVIYEVIETEKYVSICLCVHKSKLTFFFTKTLKTLKSCLKVKCGKCGFKAEVRNWG